MFLHHENKLTYVYSNSKLYKVVNDLKVVTKNKFISLKLIQSTKSIKENAQKLLGENRWQERVSEAHGSLHIFCCEINISL